MDQIETPDQSADQYANNDDGDAGDATGTRRILGDQGSDGFKHGHYH
jgi:hypothetical protein